MLIIFWIVAIFDYFWKVKVCGNKKFSIYIRGIDHPPPHCHVRFKDDSEVCVIIPLIEPMYGATISSEVYEVIADNLDALIDTWETLHPIRRKNKKNRK